MPYKDNESFGKLALEAEYDALKNHNLQLMTLRERNLNRMRTILRSLDIELVLSSYSVSECIEIVAQNYKEDSPYFNLLLEFISVIDAQHKHIHTLEQEKQFYCARANALQQHVQSLQLQLMNRS